MLYISFLFNRGVKEIIERESTIYWTEEEPPEPETATSLKVLLPGTKMVDVFRLDLDLFREWAVLIEASFKSPGSGKTLFKKHDCCVFLIDQVCFFVLCPLEALSRHLHADMLDIARFTSRTH